MVLPLAALGISAASQLYQPAPGSSASTAHRTQFQAPADSTTPSSTGGASSNALNIPTKLSSDISALLLSLQAGSSGQTAGTGTSATGTPSASSTASDPNAAIQSDLQNVLSDLQKAGGGHHHHHRGGGPPPNDASTTTTTTTTTTTADAGSSTPSNLFGQLSRALSAYASQAQGATPSTAGLLTA